MAQEYDKIVAELLVGSLPALASLYQIMPEGATFDSHRTDLQYTVERRADQLWKVHTSTEDFLLHWEIQAANDPDMPVRMLLYCGLIYQRERMPVKQTVLCIGGEPLQMARVLQFPLFDFRFNIINIREVSYRRLLEAGSPDLITLAILAGHDKVPSASFIREILTTLASHTTGLALAQRLRQIFMLARLRNLDGWSQHT